MLALKKKPDLCVWCHEAPPRAGESTLCESCFECQACGTNTAPELLQFYDILLCASCNAVAVEANDRKNKERAERANLARRIEGAGFYEAHKKVTVELLDDRQKKVVSSYIGQGNLIISGKSGSGKTWTAVALAKVLMERGHSARYLSMPWMFAFLRDCIGHDKDFQITAYVDSLLAYDYIVLDDLGAHRATEWAVETLYLILDQWEAHEKMGLICTTNLSMDEIAGSFSDRIASRLAASCKVIKLDGEDKRIGRKS